MISPSEPFLQLLEQMTPLKDAVDGYRADSIARGYSPTAAEAMALDLHRHLLDAMFRSNRDPADGR